MDTKHLSKEAIDRISFWRIHRYDGSAYTIRPSWDEYFLALAAKQRERSPDAQTKCGAVIVSPTKEVVATGYNGHVRDIEDGILPNLRPDKYDWMVHAEHNALLSCTRQGKSTLGCTVYVTGPPCVYCLQYMWQAGIAEIVHGQNRTVMVSQDDEMQIKREIFIALTSDKMPIREVFCDITKPNSV